MEINIFVMKVYRCMLILWFSKDDKVTNAEEVVCIQMYSEKLPIYYCA